MRSSNRIALAGWALLGLLVLVAADPFIHDSDASGRVKDARGRVHTVVLPGGAMTMPVQKAPASPLDPATVPKFVDDLFIPGVFSPSDQSESGKPFAYYEVSQKQIMQQVLPASAGFAMTTVVAYGPTGGDLNQYSWPSKTIEAVAGSEARVKWSNELKDKLGNCLPHIVDAVDPTLHWANPEGGASARDSNPCMDCIAGGQCGTCKATSTYRGAVPMVPHLHGANVGDESDGYPESWFLPAGCKNLANGTATEGSWYGPLKAKFEAENKQKWSAGSATYKYPNAQTPATLWFHDHTLGMTRLNVYAGTVGFYLIRKAKTSTPEAPRIPFPPPGADKTKTKSTDLRELPIAIQDRAFTTDAQLFYPVNDIPAAGKLPNNSYAPFWVPEFFPTGALGNSLACMVANGKTWPKAAVARSAYRLRLLNGCNSRTLKLSFSLKPPAANGSDTRPAPEDRIPFYVIGLEGGLLKKPLQKDQLLMGSGERVDIIFDFRADAYKGKSIYMRNAGPEGPYGSPDDDNTTPDFAPEFTSQIMRFDVVNTTTVDNRFSDGSDLDTQVVVPALPNPVRTRRFALFEGAGPEVEGMSSPLGQVVGDVGADDKPIMKYWGDAVSANPAAGTTEDWTLINYTPDGHPMHIHLTTFTIMKREAIVVTDDAISGMPTYTVTGPYPTYPEEIVCPTPGECWDDTVIVPSGSAVTVRLTFPPNFKGVYVMHCHLLEHEDNEMMRPFCVGQPNHKNPRTGATMCPGPDTGLVRKLRL